MSSALASVSATAVPARSRARRILLIAAAGHLVAAVIILARIIPQMSAMLADSPVPGHTAAMQTGLARLLYTVVLLPPMVPVAVALLIWYGVHGRARTRDFRLWMALAFAPFVAEELGRAAVVLASADAAVPGDLITQATTFTAGPAVILDLFGVTLGASAAYWVGALSFTAAVGVYCWARAITAAQEYSASPSLVRRQRRGAGLDFGLAIMTAVTVYLLAAAINFLAVPLIVPVFLSMVG